jgi:hypothetical protein
MMTCPVEGVRDLSVGVVIEELIEKAEGIGVRLSGLPGSGRDRGGEAGGLPAFEAHVEMDDVGPVDGDIFDEETDHALALSLRGSGVTPKGREVRGQRPDLGLLLVGDDSGRLGGSLAVVLRIA